MYKLQKANLYLALFGLSQLIGGILQIFYYLHSFGDSYLIDLEDEYLFGNVSMFFIMVGNMMLFLTVQAVLEQKTDIYFKLLILIFFISIGLNLGVYDIGWKIGGGSFVQWVLVIILVISIRARKKHKFTAGILLTGSTISLLTFILFFFSTLIFEADVHHLRKEESTFLSVLYSVFILGLPAAISLFLAREFAITSRRLGHKLVEVEVLSEKNLAAEKEKQEILASQNLELEKKVTERTEALTQSLHELKNTQAQLIQSEKMASLGQLTAGIAHEIQNPLNFVNNFADVNKELLTEMKEEMDKGNVEEAKVIAADVMVNEEKISHHGKRADAIVKGMLQHSRAQTGQKELTDINTLAEEYLHLALHGMREKDLRDSSNKSFNVTTKSDFDPAAGMINIVPQDIGRVLLNLFNNAFYSVSEKKKTLTDNYEAIVELSTLKNDGRLEIRVKDNGSGISKENLEKIYQPFFTTKPTGQGTGLGLSLAYDIITKGYGGEITVDTRLGESTEFTIRLPVS